jgi:hypothetical protein
MASPGRRCRGLPVGAVVAQSCRGAGRGAASAAVATGCTAVVAIAAERVVDWVHGVTAIAAVAADAQAVVTYRQAGLRGAAMNTSATIERLAAECQGVHTPALRAAAAKQPFTARQREIILAANC